jgi:spore maturation protein CgeB
LENLQRYDWAFSTKSTIIQELYGFGVKRAEYLPFAYDPSIHHLPEVINTETDHRFESDIAFVGTGDRERIHYFQELLKINGVKLKVYGPQWENMELPKSALDLPVFGHDLSLAIYLAKLSIGLVRKHNRDQSTMRTFEIAACGGCGIYEDTQEHREILNGYPDYGFFSSPSDLAEKCEWLLKHPVEREAMRQLGIRKVISESANTYLDRLKTILDLVTL